MLKGLKLFVVMAVLRLLKLAHNVTKDIVMGPTFFKSGFFLCCSYLFKLEINTPT